MGCHRSVRRADAAEPRARRVVPMKGFSALVHDLLPKEWQNLHSVGRALAWWHGGCFLLGLCALGLLPALYPKATFLVQRNIQNATTFIYSCRNLACNQDSSRSSHAKKSEIEEDSKSGTTETRQITIKTHRIMRIPMNTFNPLTLFWCVIYALALFSVFIARIVARNQDLSTVAAKNKSEK